MSNFIIVNHLKNAVFTNDSLYLRIKKETKLEQRITIFYCTIIFTTFTKMITFLLPGILPDHIYPIRVNFYNLEGRFGVLLVYVLKVEVTRGKSYNSLYCLESHSDFNGGFERASTFYKSLMPSVTVWRPRDP